jgi:acetyltransferase-like isoleucine patch superfamily enzyme
MSRLGGVFISYGGGIHPTAIIGDPPEGREWTPDSPIFAPVIDPTARIEGYVTVDAGYERPTRVGARAWLLKHVHVGHDALIGEDVEIAPGAVVCGLCEIGDGVHIGVNASILPKRLVGAGARIGAGAVVTRDVPAGETWIGNPARKLERNERVSPVIGPI